MGVGVLVAVVVVVVAVLVVVVVVKRHERFKWVGKLRVHVGAERAAPACVAFGRG